MKNIVIELKKIFRKGQRSIAVLLIICMVINCTIAFAEGNEAQDTHAEQQVETPTENDGERTTVSSPSDATNINENGEGNEDVSDGGEQDSTLTEEEPEDDPVEETPSTSSPSEINGEDVSDNANTPTGSEPEEEELSTPSKVSGKLLGGGQMLGDPSPNYLTFTAVDAGAVVKFKADSADSAAYSTDGGTTWTTIADVTTETSITLSAVGNTVMFKGRNVKTSSNSTNHFVINSGKVSASGSVTSLTDEYGSDSNVTLTEACYDSMFLGCTYLTTVPKLPATTLVKGCYKDMFNGCTGLTTVPTDLLPAMTAKEQCYEQMFYQCTELTNAPDLPATNVEDSCYRYMFYGCIKLTTPPTTLPAMTLAYRCYCSMFQGCSILTSAPSLPATSLAVQCYWRMFSECSKLAIAPALPAIDLNGANGCYMCMFELCSELTTAPNLPATTLAEECYSAMFDSCSKLTTAPATLPAETLAEDCYCGMFGSCIKLEEVPQISATTLADECFCEMFYNCTALILKKDKVAGSIEKEWKISSTNTPSDWNTDMFTDCDNVDLDGSQGKDCQLNITYYTKGSSTPTPTPTPTPSSGGSSGGGGGSSGPIASIKTDNPMPQNQNDLVVANNPVAPENISPITRNTTTDHVINANTTSVNWVTDPTTGKWKLNIGGSGSSSSGSNNANSGTTASYGFYNIAKATPEVDMNTGLNVMKTTVSTYYFDQNSLMHIGWLTTADVKTYYFEVAKTPEEGKMISGWKDIDTKWYYFNSDGVLLRSTMTPDGYNVDANGVWVK